jgi:hypothetical protein
VLLQSCSLGEVARERIHWSWREEIGGTNHLVLEEKIQENLNIQQSQPWRDSEL